jgi:hypothetical protein
VRQARDYFCCLYVRLFVWGLQATRNILYRCFVNPSHRCRDLIIRVVFLEEYQPADEGAASAGLFRCLSMSLGKLKSVEQ